jgi:2-iminobutanoate/2-iminopropanoate deaminase
MYGSFPYSQAVKAAGLVWVAGQGPFDPVSGAVVGATIQEQTRQCLANIEAILKAAGMNEEWVRWFPTDPPARQGARHPLDIDGLRISIAVVAEA